jgi:tetratricopeptide (TPR) repeat protein
MVITFPFVLLLLDYWPLERIEIFEEKKRKGGDGKERWQKVWKLVLEKIPLFLFIPLFSFLTFYAQKEAHAVVPLGNYGLLKRIANAIISYFTYIRKMFLPTDLAAYYPINRGDVPLLLLFISIVVLSLITFLAIYFREEKKYLLSGWLWYLGILLPVIGIVKVGDQAMADRYTYIPLIGVFWIVVWSISDLAENNSYVKKIVWGILCFAIIIMIISSRFYVGLWKNEETLFKWAISKTEGNWFAHNNLGSYLIHKGAISEAAYHINEALKINPNISNAHLNVGYYLAEQKGDYATAIEHYKKAVELDPKSVKGWDNLGLALSKTNQLDEAIECFQKAKELDPSFFDAYFNLGYAYSLKGEYDKAVSEYQKAIEIDKNNAKTYNELGATMIDAGRFSEAIDYLEEALRLSPQFIEPRTNLALAFTRQGKYKEAEEEYNNIIKMKPDAVNVINDLGLLLMKEGRNSEAKEKFMKAIEISPNYENSYINLGVLFANQKKFEEATQYFKMALEINPASEIARSNFEKVKKILGKKQL